MSKKSQIRHKGFWSDICHFPLKTYMLTDIYNVDYENITIYSNLKRTSPEYQALVFLVIRSYLVNMTNIHNIINISSNVANWTMFQHVHAYFRCKRSHCSFPMQLMCSLQNGMLNMYED